MSDIEREVFERIMANQADFAWLETSQQYASVVTENMWRTWKAARAQQGEDYVSVPSTVEQARAMALTGIKWLEDNAPDQIVRPTGVADRAPEGWRDKVKKAAILAAVFDDGGDGADDESARGVVAILNELLTAAPSPEQGQAAPGSEQLTWALDEDAAGALRDFIGDDTCPQEVTLSVGEIRDESSETILYGLRCWSSDYPEEGAILLSEMANPNPTAEDE